MERWLATYRQAHEFPMLVPKWTKLQMVTVTAIGLSSWIRKQLGVWSKDSASTNKTSKIFMIVEIIKLPSIKSSITFIKQVQTVPQY